VQYIVDPADARLDDFRNIPDAELIRRRGVFVAEGRLVVQRLLRESRLRTRALMLTAAAHAAMADVLATLHDTPVYVVPQTVMDEVAGFPVHRGCVALGEHPRATPWRAVIRDARLVLVLERVADPDNIGAMFRSAAALGTDAVLLDPVTTDPLYRKAIRTSMGATLLMPFARMEPWPAGLEELSALGFATVALTPAPTADPIHEVATRIGSRPIALVLGHEGDGLTAHALEGCDYFARIPIGRRVDSLNVATAAAIALYACRRDAGRDDRGPG
jgi:tRNA G18 (ribose-2'-O)-methylase SpoU